MVEFLGKVVLLLGWMLVLAEADVAHLRGVNPASGRSLNPGPNVNFYTEPVAFGTFSGYPAYAGPKLVSQKYRRHTFPPFESALSFSSISVSDNDDR